jgi:hypothetical protein
MKLIKYSMSLVAAISLLLAGRVNADMVSYVVDYGTPTPLTIGGSAINLNLDKFNTALGTLTSVTIILTSNDAVYGQIINGTDVVQGYNSDSAAMPVTVTAIDSLTTTTTGTATYGAGTVPGPQFNVTTLPTVNLNGLVSSATLNSGFADYEGVGVQTFNLSVSSPSGSYAGSAVNPGSIFFGGDGSSSGSVEIEYTYTDIPEPSAYIMLASGLGLLFAFRRRK